MPQLPLLVCTICGQLEAALLGGLLEGLELAVLEGAEEELEEGHVHTRVGGHVLVSTLQTQPLGMSMVQYVVKPQDDALLALLLGREDVLDDCRMRHVPHDVTPSPGVNSPPAEVHC